MSSAPLAKASEQAPLQNEWKEKPLPEVPSTQLKHASHSIASFIVKPEGSPRVPVPPELGNENRGAWDGRCLSNRSSSLKLNTGQATFCANGKSGTLKPCAAPCKFFAHLIKIEQLLPVKGMSARHGRRVESKDLEETGSKDESLASEKNVTERRDAKTMPLSPNVRANLHN